MSFQRLLGGHAVLGIGMSKEKIEELLYSMNQTRVGVTIPGEDETNSGQVPPGTGKVNC
jgi:hypothetical protein